MGKVTVSSLKLKSVAACAFSGEKNKGGIVVAYLKDDTPAARFVFIDMPRKKLYGREEFLSAVAAAEGVDGVNYNDDENRPYDILICRSGLKAEDFVPRDYAANRYTGSFAEITSANVKFAVAEPKPECKFYAACDIAVKPQVGLERKKYADGSLEFAIVNAYNAALLGRLFTREKMYLETKSGEHVRVEVRTDLAPQVNSQTLFVFPNAGSDGFIDSYVTEEFNYFDGGEVTKRTYEIKYKNQLHDYFSMSIRG